MIFKTKTTNFSNQHLVPAILLVSTTLILCGCITDEERAAREDRTQELTRQYQERTNYQTRNFVSTTHPELGEIKISSQTGISQTSGGTTSDNFLQLRPANNGKFPNMSQAADDAALRNVIYELEGTFVCPEKTISTYTRGKIGNTFDQTYQKSQTIKTAFVNCAS